MAAPVISSLLAAVPSFARQWAEYVADQAEYTAEFPGAAVSESETEYEFLCQLSRHLGERLREAGGLQEVAAALAALDPLYRDADRELADRLTITLLEGIILAAAACEGPLPALDAVAARAPARVAWEYRRARDYLRGPAGSTGDCWVRG